MILYNEADNNDEEEEAEEDKTDSTYGNDVQFAMFHKSPCPNWPRSRVCETKAFEINEQ